MNGSEYAHERIDRLERTVELMSEFLAMQVQINTEHATALRNLRDDIGAVSDRQGGFI